MICLALIIKLAWPAVGAYEYHHSSPELLFPYITAVSDQSYPASISNPAMAPYIKKPFLHASASFVYSPSDITSNYVKFGASMGIIGVQAAWSRFGIEGYQENMIELGCGAMPSRYIAFGLQADYADLSVKTPEASTHTGMIDASASVLIIPFSFLEISFIQKNITSVLIKNRQDLLFPAWSAGLQSRPFKGFALQWNISKTPAGYINSFSASAHLIKYISFFAGYARECDTYSASFIICYKNISASYGIRYHNELGITHCAGLTLSIGELYPETLNASFRDNQEKFSKVNIKTCTKEDLIALGLEDKYSFRIIKYRDTFGNVSIESLCQIGMSDELVNKYSQFMENLSFPDKSHEETRPQIRRISLTEKKQIFEELLGLGLKASSSLRIIEAICSGSKKNLDFYISSSDEIDEQKKREVMKKCSRYSFY
jgi:hypothetical protein